MRWFQRLRRRQSEAEYVQEIESHLAHEIDEQVDRGVTPEEARYAAVRNFGNITRHLERFREGSWRFWLETLWQDVRFGWRSLWRTPVLTLVAIISLAHGIGANAALYTIADALLLRPLRLPDAERMFVIRAPDHQLGFLPGLTPTEAGELLELAQTFGPAGLYTEWAGPTRYGDEITMEWFLFASEGAVEAFGIAPQLGRWPTEDEHRIGAPVAVITDRFWQQQGRDPDVLGRRLRTRARQNIGSPDVEFTIVGVAPPALHGRLVGMPYSAIMPRRALEALDPGSISKPFVIWAGLLGRLIGYSRTEAAARMAAFELPPRGKETTPRKFELVAAADIALPNDRRAILTRALGWLSVFAGIVLLLGCVNLSSAMLARSEARRHELAMRISLGASQARLLRLVTVEYLLLAVLSTAAALPTSQLMLHAFPASLALGRKWLIVPTDVPLGLSLSVVAYAVAVGLGACIIFGIGPAAAMSRVDPMTALRSGGLGRHSPGNGSRRVLLGVQVGVSSLLLVCALLVGRAVVSSTSMDLGYSERGHLLYARVQPASAKPEAVAALRAAVLERLSAHPSFLAAAFSRSFSPFEPGAVGDRLIVDGVERVPQSRELARNMTGGRLYVAYADAVYRQTVGLPLLEGRDLQAGDGGTAPGVLVNEVLARQLWPHSSAVGNLLRVHTLNGLWHPSKGAARVVGVIGNARYDVRHGTAPSVYFLEDGTQAIGLYVRMRDDAHDAVGWVRQVLHAVQPQQAPPLVVSREEYVRAELAPERLILQILGWFSGLAVVLSLLGVYGISSDTVARRKREIAIRLALGAPERAVARLVTSAALRPAFAGLAGGLIAGVLAALAVRSLVFGLNPLHAQGYLLAAALIMVVAWAGVWTPVRRAVRIAPADVLKAE